ncbi:MAG: DUF3127 domain-containing protein [Muribaculaceae bacterium]|nr:DUF3127 domain-containing protein [Muribaculaceae bacterium]
MEIKGKIIHAAEEQSGVSKAGNAWKKKEYVLETIDSQYPRKVAFTCFGDNADKIILQVGQVATIYFDIESREYNNRWYTDLRCWRADVEQPLEAGQAQQTVQSVAPEGSAVPPPPMPTGTDEELPF